MIAWVSFESHFNLYDHWCAWHSSEFSLNVPVAIYIKGMSLNIKDYWKIIDYREIIGGSQNIDNRYR
jgi:hypothetical protein